MGPETFITTIETAICRIVRLGLAWRRPAVADLVALAAVDATILPDGGLVYVTSEANLYEWAPDSTATDDGSTVIASTTLAPSARGRWLIVSTTWTYGAGGTNLAQKQTGYLRAVEPYASMETSQGEEDGILSRIAAQTPSVCVQFVGDEIESYDNQPGTLYSATLGFKLIIASTNLRAAPAAVRGDGVSDDPGVYRIIGDLRRLFGGLSFDNGVEGVERIEIGGSELISELEDRRVYIWGLDLVVKASFAIEDEDLAVDGEIWVQPKLTEFWPLPKWDKMNYIATGGTLSGSGLTRTVDATTGLIAGSAISFAASSVTLSADKDTYRDLDPSTGWHFTTVPVGSPQPPITAGRLRVAVSRTTATDIEMDVGLCSFSAAYGSPRQVV